MQNISEKSGSSPKTFTKVLIIDQNEQSRVACRNALEQSYLVLEADSGIHGIDLTIDTEPDLIFVSVELPDMNGFEVASRLQILVPKTPLVALSEKVLLGTKDFGLAVGFYGYLEIPFTDQEILHTAKIYLNGKRETTEKKDEYLIAYQSELAHRLEMKVREQTDFKRRANYLIEQNNIMIDLLERRRKLLEAAAKSATEINAKLFLDELLPSASETIQKIYNLDFFGIYLVDEHKNSITLAAASQNNNFDQGDHDDQIGSILSESIKKQKAIFSPREDAHQLDQNNFRSSNNGGIIGLPLILGNKVLGGIKIVSNAQNMFEETDITALQILADQLAIAIQNTQTLEELEHANKELIRTKTFEAIATATGEAIHWVGNKAAPISGSAARVREDIINFIVLFTHLLSLPEKEKQSHPFWETYIQTRNKLEASGIDYDEMLEKLYSTPISNLPLILDIDSSLEDLTIIENSARTILNIKEDLIGPARKQEIEEISIQSLLLSAGKSLGLPKDVLAYEFKNDLPPVIIDRRQLERVYTNLIKNAWEALRDTPTPKITLTAEIDPNVPDMIRTTVIDNGPGIPKEIIEKIWVTFFTTKKEHGGTGLGLSACLEIINQIGGQIHVESEPNKGAKFIVLLPCQTK